MNNTAATSNTTRLITHFSLVTLLWSDDLDMHHGSRHGLVCPVKTYVGPPLPPSLSGDYFFVQIITNKSVHLKYLPRIK
jgi:hypothetical protein